MPSEITAAIAKSSIARSLSELRAWSEFGARLRQLRRGVGITIPHVEQRSGVPHSRINAIESGIADSPDDFTPPTDDELRAYLSALDAEPEPWIREAERIRKEHG